MLTIAPAATRKHRRDLVTHAVEDAIQVDVDDLAPAIERIVAHLLARAANAGIVDGQMQRAALLHGEIDQRLAGLRIGRVRGKGECAAPGAGDLVADGLGLVLSDVGDDDGSAFGGQFLRDSRADARGRAGDDRCPAFELHAHVVLLKTGGPRSGLCRSRAGFMP